MEKVEKTHYQAAFAITGKVLVGLNFMMNWAGRAHLTVAGLDAFFRSIRLEITLPMFTSMKNYHHFVHPCIELLIKITFTR